MRTKKNKYDFESLMKAIQNNNESVLQDIYSEVYPKVEYYILSNSGSKDQAKDVFQDAFLVMWNNVKNDKFSKSHGSIQGYVYQIAKYKWIDILRSPAHRYNNVIEKDYGEEDEIEIDNAFEKDRNVNEIIKTLDLLSEACKQLLELFYFEKKSIDKIALTMNIESASARNKKYRCMQKLRSLVLKEDIKI